MRDKGTIYFNRITLRSYLCMAIIRDIAFKIPQIMLCSVSICGTGGQWACRGAQAAGLRIYS